MLSNANDRNPIQYLADQVLKGKLTLKEALARVATEGVLAQVSDTLMDQLDASACALADQDLARATVLAVLNCQAARSKGSDVVWGNCNSTLGWLYLQQDSLEMALYHYQEALKAFEPRPKAQRTVAQIRVDVGEIRKRQRDFDTAIREYEQVITLAEQRATPRLKSTTLNGLGGVYLAQENADQALVTFQQALETSQACDDRRAQATALGNLGLAHRFLGHLDRAVEYHEQALDISSEISHQAGLGRHLSNLGNALLERGELDKAELHLKRALAIARQRHDRRGEQQRLGNLGNLHQARAARETDPCHKVERLAEAEQSHHDAVSIARELGDRRSLGNHLTNLGNVHSEAGRFEAAQACYEEALRLAKEQRAVDTQWRVHYAWGNLCVAQGPDRQALDHYVAAIQIVEEQRYQLRDIESRMKFWQERATLYKHTVLCCLRLDELWPALEYTEQAKARYLADLLAQRSSPAGDAQETIRQTLAALPPRTAVVVFNVTEAGTVVFIVTAQPTESDEPSADDHWQRSSDGCIRARLIERFDRTALQRTLVQVDGSGQATGGYLVDYYAKRKRWMDSTLESACAQVYQCLLAPVHQELARLPVERIVLMPNLGLSLLPLHACYEKNGTGRDYLLDHYGISYAPSFDVLRHCQAQVRPEPPGGRSLFAVANPTGNLAWADVEVERIAGLFSEARILGGGKMNRATQASVIAEAPDYAYVHFACHGKFILREPLQSELRLAEPDLLTLETMLKGPPSAQANPDTASKGLVLPRTRLVVLSACETGLVDPGDLADEYVGLPSGFLKAGVPAVVSSLWRVDDLSTALLMEEFYRRHVVEQEGAAEALRGAQRWLRDLKRDKLLARVTVVYDAATARIQDSGGDPCSTPWLQNLDAWRKYWGRHHPEDCPLAHPYYWAAFTTSGALASQARL